MKNRNTWIVVTLVVIAIGIYAAIRYANNGGVKSSAVQAPPQAALQKGQKAPQFTAATDRGYFNLAATNRPVFLEIFATWCPHCQRETAIIDRLYQAYKNRVQFVAVSGSNRAMDGQSQSSPQDVLTFIQRFNVQYPAAYDPSLTVAREYLQSGFPTLVVIARNKTIDYAGSGETPYGELSAAIESALR